MWQIVYKNDQNIPPKMQVCMQCDFALPLHQKVKSVSSLRHLESGLDHVIFFGRWNISNHHTGRSLKRYVHWDFTSLAAENPVPPGEHAQAGFLEDD